MSTRPADASTEFDPYYKWLGIPKELRPPTLYELLGIDPEESDPEVIENAFERQKRTVERHRGSGQDAKVKSVLYELEEANSTLRNPKLRQQYEAQLKITLRRRAAAEANGPAGSNVKPVGEGAEWFRQMAGILISLVIGFGIMGYLFFRVPWSKLAPSETANRPANDPPPVAKAAPPVVAAAPVEQPPPKGEPVEQKPTKADSKPPADPKPAEPQQPELVVAPFTQEVAQAKQAAWSDLLKQPVERIDATGIKLQLIPPGEFQMGSPSSDTAQSIDEVPQHRVRITRPFYLGKYEITRGQFKKFVDATNYVTEAEKDRKGGFGYTGNKRQPFLQARNYSWKNTGYPQTDDHPVTNVTSNDALALCNWLSTQESRTYRLPTEAEWEYACRAGTDTIYQGGNDAESLATYGNISDATTREKFPTLKSIKARDEFVFPSPVGKFRANQFGLHDMQGNVFEWCNDWYDKTYYQRSPVDDPKGPNNSPFRTTRGGAWFSGPANARSAYRNWDETSNPLGNLRLGIRVACDVAAK